MKTRIRINLLHYLESANMKIFGHINDSSTGQPMPYINIAKVGTSIGTTTDGNGFFELEGDNIRPSWEFTISHIGYTTTKRKASNMQGDSIYMNKSNTQLNEVLIVGNKKKNTSSDWLSSVLSGFKIIKPDGIRKPIVNGAPNQPNPNQNGYIPLGKKKESFKITTLGWAGIGVGVLLTSILIIVVVKRD